MIKLFFILVFTLCLTSSLWAFEISIDEKISYRIYIGEDKKVDWVDLREIRALDDIDIIIFRDLSPIEEIYKYESEILNPTYIIKKKNSIWTLYWNYNPIECVINLNYPIVDRYSKKYLEKIERKERLIYKR